MKKLYFISIILIIFVFYECSEKNNDNENSIIKGTSEMKFESKLIHDFGVIEGGGDVNTIFIFKNEGDEPLIITNIKTSCGCTTPAYPKEPIKVDEKGEIKVKFNTKGRDGQFTKSVTVYSNAKNSPVVLKIKGDINNEN